MERNYLKLKLHHDYYKSYEYIIYKIVYSNGSEKKFYKILKDNKSILHTSLHQTFYRYKRNIENNIIKEEEVK